MKIGQIIRGREAAHFGSFEVNTWERDLAKVSFPGPRSWWWASRPLPKIGSYPET